MTILCRAGVVVVLSAIAIELHEVGHRAVFWLTSTPARMGFQRVNPTVPVSHALWLWGKAGGPLVTLVLSVALFSSRGLRARSSGRPLPSPRQLRLFPLGFDLVRAMRARCRSPTRESLPARSAEPCRSGSRSCSVCCAVFGTLSVLAARTFPFRRGRWLGVAAVYLGSLAVGIGAVLADELLGIHGR